MKSHEKCVKLISQGTVIALIGSLLIGSQPSEAAPANAFVVYSYQGKQRCLDYTPEKVESPIFINSCSSAHPIIVEEINTQHNVRLHEGTKVIGAQVPQWIISNNGAAPADTGVQEIPLVLQNPLTESRYTVGATREHTESTRRPLPQP